MFTTGGRPNKFLYTGKTQKTVPWGNDDSFEFTEMKKDFSNSKPTVSPSGKSGTVFIIYIANNYNNLNI